MQAKPSLFILILLISFGSVGAVIFTPGLPGMAAYFNITDGQAALTITWYLVGYAFGQLLYGPLANRFGSRKTITMGVLLAIVGTVLCILSAPLHSFNLLLFARLTMALGAACGLKMTFTLASKLLSKEESARAMAILTMAFAITPGLSVFLGGLFVSEMGWTGPFYLMLAYAIFILILAGFLPEAYQELYKDALQLKPLLRGYIGQFCARKVLAGGLLLGTGTCLVYIFAAVSPFIAMRMMHLDPSLYGAFNFIPSLGILFGSLTATKLGRVWTPKRSLFVGVMITFVGVITFLLALLRAPMSPWALFLPMVIVYFGFAFVFANAGALALHDSADKGNASAVMSFVNMGSALVAVLIIGCFTLTQAWLLPVIYLGLLLLALGWYRLLTLSE